MDQILAGKKAVITGAASGIGEAIAKRFLEAGAEILVVDMDPKLTDIFADGSIHCLIQDVTAQGAADTIAEAVTAKLGALDILVNNAGIAAPSTIETTSDELWDKVMSVNVTSMFKITRSLLPLLKLSAHGRIINLGSIMSDMAGPDLFVYGTSKHAVAGMTKSLAVDLGPYGITANYLQPGSIVTALSAPFFEDAEFRAFWEAKAPLGRLGQPQDVCGAALFLASDAAQFVSGVGLNVDGGAIVKF